MRLIDADALLSEWAENPPSYDMGNVINSVKNFPTVSGWISVDDRLPEDEMMVIGYTPVDGYMFVGFHRTYVSANYSWSAWYIVTSMRSTKKITKKVTHWMPLPNCPRCGSKMKNGVSADEN